MSQASSEIRHALLEGLGVRHGFGLRGTEPPAGTLRPSQVHGIEVARATARDRLDRRIADAVVSSRTDVAIAIVTADCVPILASTRDGTAVAAIHAGWRGLVAGVVGCGIRRLREEAGDADAAVVAVVGPYIGACCYEVDAPVLDAARRCFGDALADHLQPSRPHHARIDLGGLAARALGEAGVARGDLAIVPNFCTSCDPDRFHSFRRDGRRAGRLQHHIRAARG
jgi:YfiH family protein